MIIRDEVKKRLDRKMAALTGETIPHHGAITICGGLSAPGCRKLDIMDEVSEAVNRHGAESLVRTTTRVTGGASRPTPLGRLGAWRCVNWSILPSTAPDNVIAIR